MICYFVEFFITFYSFLADYTIALQALKTWRLKQMLNIFFKIIYFLEKSKRNYTCPE